MHVIGNKQEKKKNIFSKGRKVDLSEKTTGEDKKKKNILIKGIGGLEGFRTWSCGREAK